MHLGFAIGSTLQVLLEWFALLKVTRQSPLKVVRTYHGLYVDQRPRMLTLDCWRGIFVGRHAYNTASRLNRLVRRYYIRIFRRIQAETRGIADRAISVRADGTMSAFCWIEFLPVKDALVTTVRHDTHANRSCARG